MVRGGGVSRQMRGRRTKTSKEARTAEQFAAEAAYAESIFRNALGDPAASIAALRNALTLKPDYAPALLSMGSVEYQRKRRAEGRRLFLSLLALPEDTKDLAEIIDEAGSFLIGIGEYADGLELYREAARRFSADAAIQQGIGCCAGHEGSIELDPANAVYVSDLGWTLVLAKRYQHAEATLQRAVRMDPSNERAVANLEYCRARMAKSRRPCPSNPATRPTGIVAKPLPVPTQRKRRVTRRD
jgi:tetratricopeptide (TPR) repeat protein